jgi:hypothetical protein
LDQCLIAVLFFLVMYLYEVPLSSGCFPLLKTTS